MKLATEETKVIWKSTTGSEHTTKENATDASIKHIISHAVQNGYKAREIIGFLTKDLEAKEWLLQQLGVTIPNTLTAEQAKEIAWNALHKAARAYGSNEHQHRATQVHYLLDRIKVGATTIDDLARYIAEAIKSPVAQPQQEIEVDLGLLGNTIYDVCHSLATAEAVVDRLKKAGYKVVKA